MRVKKQRDKRKRKNLGEPKVLEYKRFERERKAECTLERGGKKNNSSP
jgi:hypothetical protein